MDVHQHVAATNEERRCSNCIHAKKVDDITYECDAQVYDIDNKTCFAPKEKAKKC